VNKKVTLLFAASSILLTIVFFRNGNILGGGESGAPFYNITRMYHDSTSPWLDGLLGGYVPQSVANIPLLWIFSILETIGLPGVIIQSIFTFLALLLSLVSFYLLVKELFQKYGITAYTLSSFFYLFNFYSVINIWNRFLLNFILFYSVLPLFVWLFLRFLRSQKFIYLGIFLLLSFLLSYAFSSPAHIIIFWSILLFTTVVELISKKWRLKTIILFISGLILWALVNFWWISQQLNFGVSESFKSISGTYFSNTGNNIGLEFLSVALGKLENLYLLKHGLYYNSTSGFIHDWPQIYKIIAFLILEWLLVFAVLFWSIRRRKKKAVIYALGMFLAGIFLAKGVSAPLGEMFRFFFNSFSFFQFFRNPFEKLGIIAALGFSLMVGPALSDIIRKLSLRYRRFGRIVLGFCFIYVFVILGFPFWTGLVFTGSQPPFNDPEEGYEVVVPSYYKEADRWLESQDKDTRFVTLPLGGEGIEYDWPKGYLGVEESQILFSNQNISNKLSFPFYDQVSSSLERLFSQNVDFYKIASALNVKYILFRPDINYRSSGMKSPAYMGSLFEQRRQSGESKISLASEFGPLKFYQFDDDAIHQKIYATVDLINAGENIDMELFLVSDPEFGEVIYNSSGKSDKDISELTGKYIVRNTSVFKLGGEPYPSLTEAPHIFPFVSSTSGSRVYPYILMKEKLQSILIFNTQDKLEWEILLLGKRLKEAQLAISLGEIDSAKKSLDIYSRQLPGVMSRINLFSLSIKSPNEQVWNEGTMITTFNSHLFLLNEFEVNDKINSDGFVTQLKDKFLLEVSGAKILPYYKPLISEEFPLQDRVVYNFTVGNSGQYELFIPSSSFFPDDFSMDEEIWIQVDGEALLKRIITKGDKVSLGFFDFSTGPHEISLNISPIVNLVSAENDRNFTLNATDREVSKSFDINKYDPYSKYLISFEYLINYGEGPVLRVALNNDKINIVKQKEVLEYFYENKLAPDDYDYSSKEFISIFHPDPASDEMKLIFSLRPWNNCRKIYFKKPEICDDPIVSKPFERPSKVEIKDLKLAPLHPEDLFAVSEVKRQERISPNISFDKTDHIHYVARASGVSGPFVLVFSELFDRGWKARIDGKDIPEEKQILVNSYANGWLVNSDKEDLDIEIRFEPHYAMRRDFRISAASLGSILAFLLLTVVKKRVKLKQ